MKPVIDWTVFHKRSEQTIECVCGAVYRSHCKFVIHEGELMGFTEKPCPVCGKDDHIRRASSDREEWSI